MPNLKSTWICVALQMVSASVFSCSLARPEPFSIRRIPASMATFPAPKFVSARLIGFSSADPENDDCAGAGLIMISIASKAVKAGRKTGFIIRAISGVHDEGMFPDEPKQPMSVENGQASILWGWYGLTTDPDGHIRWNLEVIEVKKDGSRSRPASVCVSTDKSCPHEKGQAESGDQ
jgi:hypothetical protein